MLLQGIFTLDLDNFDLKHEQGNYKKWKFANQKIYQLWCLNPMYYPDRQDIVNSYKIE